MNASFGKPLSQTSSHSISSKNQYIIAVVLLAFMIITRGNISAHLQDASWAIFFLVGFYLRDKSIARLGFPVFFLAAFAIDLAVIDAQGGVHYCFTPAYPFLIPAYSLLTMLATGVGLINAAIVPIYPSYQSIYNAFSKPLYFISGVFFTADFLAPEVYAAIDFNPLIHLVEWFRSGFYPSFQSHLYDPEYAISVCVGIFAIGLVVERVNSKNARQV